MESGVHEEEPAIIQNSPNNPTGKVFSRAELRFIAALCADNKVIAITDEIYEHILYNGKKHISIGSLDGIADRTITIGRFSKTYSVTGWRIGYALASGCTHGKDQEDPRFPSSGRASAVAP